MENLQLDRLKFREIRAGQTVEIKVLPKEFIPTGNKKPQAPPAPPPPPVYNDNDMKEAERNGYKKGFLEGVKEGQKQAESEQAAVNRQLVAMMDRFVSAVTPLLDHYKKTSMQLQQDMPKMALAVARKVAGQSLNENAAAVVCDTVMRCCTVMLTETKLTITAHESMCNTLEQKLHELASKIPTACDIIIQRDPEMTVSDCRIEWQNGTMTRSTEQLWQELEKAIGNIATVAVRDANQQMITLEADVHQANQTPDKKE